MPPPDPLPAVLPVKVLFVTKRSPPVTPPPLVPARLSTKLDASTVTDCVPWAPPPPLVASLSRNTLPLTAVMWAATPPPIGAWFPVNSLSTTVRPCCEYTPPPPSELVVAPSRTTSSRTATPPRLVDDRIRLVPLASMLCPSPSTVRAWPPV